MAGHLKKEGYDMSQAGQSSETSGSVEPQAVPNVGVGSELTTHDSSESAPMSEAVPADSQAAPPPPATPDATKTPPATPADAVRKADGDAANEAPPATPDATVTPPTTPGLPTTAGAPPSRPTAAPPKTPKGAARDPAEAKREAAELSEAADVEMQQKYPGITFEPEYGPLEAVVPPKPEGKMIPNKYHVVVSVDCNVYMRWQVLAHYWWYLRLKEQYPDSPMGGYTRLLHCAMRDDIMHLIPSFRVNELPADIVRNYPPVNRPWAFVQWLARMPLREQYVMMSEPDHLMLVPPPLLATPTQMSAFPFRYMSCEQEETRPLCEDLRFNPNNVSVDRVPPIGSSPTIMSTEMMFEIVPRWDRIMRAIHDDEAASAGFGWVNEMYAFALAAATPTGPSSVRLNRCLMLHPPYDRKLAIDTEQVRHPVACQQHGERFVNVSVLHYTYGQHLDADGNGVEPEDAVWNFNKRDHMASYPPLPIPAPPEGACDAVKALIARINEAGLSPELYPWWRANVVPPQ